MGHDRAWEMAQLKRRSNDKRRKISVGPQIVRAWFDTVINPLHSWLTTVDTLLAARNWTWRFQPARLEVVRHVSAYVDARPNWEQFKQLHPQIGHITEIHDQKVDALAHACQDF